MLLWNDKTSQVKHLIIIAHASRFVNQIKMIGCIWWQLNNQSSNLSLVDVAQKTPCLYIAGYMKNSKRKMVGSMDEISVAVEIVYLKVWQVLLFLLTVQPALSNYRKSPGKQTNKQKKKAIFLDSLFLKQKKFKNLDWKLFLLQISTGKDHHSYANTTAIKKIPDNISYSEKHFQCHLPVFLQLLL